MKNNKVDLNANDFGADEILKEVKEVKEVIDEIKEAGKEELKPIKFYKTYELNDEGLRLYGMYKKQQHLNIIKWSLLGTCMGCFFSAFFDISFKKMNYRTKDYLKTFFLVGSMGLFTFYGIQASSMHFRAQQRELSQLYGREVEEKE